ncbi:type II toxin-antitoxin system VapB family antitoxin [uncultured Methylobacterium sp.]|uniref:type II toxin-antitoxin system VapB family antitoxin n=1 Tax=uncultured Methylobacterium sp. TaxID=157278 RepID=UPI0035CC4FC2
MSITIENAEAETLLAEMSARTGRAGSDLLLDLLRRERERLEDETARRIAEGLAADDEMRARWNARALVDPRPIDEILAFDENGLPM